MATTEIRYIEVDATHRIEVMPSGEHFAQHVTNPQFIGTEYDGWQWGYYRTGNQSRSFKTENGARNFLAAQPGEFATIEEAWAALQAVPSYCERDLSHEWVSVA